MPKNSAKYFTFKWQNLKEIESAKKVLNGVKEEQDKYSKTRKAATDALIYWAKTGMRQFTMRDAVNDYLEASGAYRPSIGGEETILAHKK